MVVLNRVGEQEVEPVGIPILCSPQVSSLCCSSIGESELSGSLVILADELVHLSVDTAVHAVCGLCVIEVTFLLEFLIDGHLVLGVHDVESRVHRLQTGGILSGVADMTLAGLTFLRSDDDDSRHRARAINRSSRSILEDIEGLDIIRVQARDSGTDKGGRVS